MDGRTLPAEGPGRASLGHTGLGVAKPRCEGRLEMVQSQPWVWEVAWAVGVVFVVVLRAQCVNWDCHWPSWKAQS